QEKVANSRILAERGQRRVVGHAIVFGEVQVVEPAVQRRGEQGGGTVGVLASQGRVAGGTGGQAPDGRRGVVDGAVGPGGLVEGPLGLGHPGRTLPPRRRYARPDERRQRRGRLEAGGLVAVGQGGVILPPVAPAFRPVEVRPLRFGGRAHQAVQE